MITRIIHNQQIGLLIGLGLVTAMAILYALYHTLAVAALLAIAVLYLAVKLGTGPLSQLSARIPLSLRWKTSGTVFLILGVLLAVSLAGLAAVNSTHGEIHRIQEFRSQASPRPMLGGILQNLQGPEAELLKQMQERNAQMSDAIDRLEKRQHWLLTWIPAVVFGGGLVAVALGMALSSTLTRSIKKISEATRRLASGDFSQPVVVPDRDEMGELAERLNTAARDLARLQEALVAQEQARSLQERIAQVTLAQEEERRRISRELHDGLGTSLADMANRLSVCLQLVRDDPLKVERGLNEVITLLRQQISEIRELINQLRPLALDQLGLVEALHQYVERFDYESGIDASLIVSGSLPANPLTEVTVYRVVQESLTNIRKHAQATAVQVDLRVSEHNLEVAVSDDGRGFDTEKAVHSTTGGIGLTSMRERAELVGGSFTIESNPGQGCRTVLRIPMER